MFQNSSEEKKLDWMYKGPASAVDREEYLLGRSVDKSLEQFNESEKSGADLKLPKNHVEHECIPPSIRDFKNLTTSEQVDLQQKLQEDPLFAIKKQEEETRRRLLQNPVQLKKLQEALRLSSSKSKKSKSKKKSKKSTHDIDTKLAEKYVQFKDQIDTGSLKKKHKEKDDLDELLLKKFKSLKKKLGSNIDEILDLESSSSDSEQRNHQHKHRKKKKTKSKSRNSSEENSRSKNRNKRNDGKEDVPQCTRHISNTNSDSSDSGIKRKKSRKRNSSRDREARESKEIYDKNKRVSDDDERNRSEKQLEKNREYSKYKFTSGYEDEKSSNLTREKYDRRKEQSKIFSRTKEATSRNDERSRKRGIEEAECEKINKDKTKVRTTPNNYNSSNEGYGHRKKQTNQDAKEKHHHTSSSSSDDDNLTDSADDENIKKPKKVNYGLVKADGSKLPLKKIISQVEKQPKNIDKKEETVPKQHKVVKKISEQEKERLRMEMMENAKWRDTERERNIRKYRDEEKKESELQKKNKFNHDFVKDELRKTASSSTVESRIKSNIYNIQRSNADMNTHFSRRY